MMRVTYYIFINDFTLLNIWKQVQASELKQQHNVAVKITALIKASKP